MSEPAVPVVSNLMDLSREDKLRAWELFYLRNMAEDPRDGTVFDCDILDAIKELRKKYVTKYPSA